MVDSADHLYEKRLVERAIAGDSEAFGHLYELYLDQLYRYIYFRVSNAREAEDLTEEVFVRAWEALPDYDVSVHASIAPWLYRIAHNLVVDHYRRRSRHEDAEPLFAVEEHPPSVEELIWQNEQIGEAIGALHQLSQIEQSVLLLRFVEGASYREIGEIVDKSEGACRVIQYRALSALRDMLKRK